MSASISAAIAIANRALAAVGTRSTITSFSENSNEAANVSLIYAPVRRQVLRATHWKFAAATAALTLLKSAPGTPENTVAADGWSNAFPPPGWLYEYVYPADCLNARKLVPNWSTAAGDVPLFPPGAPGFAAPCMDAPGARFDIVADKDGDGADIMAIVANVDRALLIYTREVAEEAWDALATEALVYALAANLTLALTGNLKLASDRAQFANAAIMQARVASANEGPTILDYDPEWIAEGHGWIRGTQGQGGFVWPHGPLFAL